MRNVLCLILFFIAFAFGLHAQTFKPVKTGQDVIDNYLTAIGGETKLKDIKSIEITGGTNEKKSNATLFEYIGRKEFYLRSESDEINVTEAYDKSGNKGWISLGIYKEDMKDDYLKTFSIFVESSLWRIYYDHVKNGITFELKDDDIVSETPCYVVDVIQSDTELIETDHFDKTTFYKIQQDVGPWSSEMTANFGEYRKESSLGIMMPYRIATKLGRFNITNYNFNTSFDRGLLRKP